MVGLGTMPKKDPLKWARDHPKIAVAAANLRISGISEEAIFRAFRGASEHTTPKGRALPARRVLLKDPPTYAELRAALKERGVGSKREATALRRERVYFKPNGERYTAEPTTGGTSRYLARRNDKIANPTAGARTRLEENTIVGRTLAASDNPEEYADAKVVDFLESEFEGYPV
jgi:hypothetical protein